jgi:hypothetical protein
MNMSETLDEAYDLYKKMFFHQVGVSLACYVASMAIISVCAAVVLGMAFTAAFVSSSLGPPFAMMAVLGYIVIIVLHLWQGAASVLAWQAWMGVAPSVGIALKRSFGSFLRLASVAAIELACTVPVLFMIYLVLEPMFKNVSVYSLFELSPAFGIASLVIALVMGLGWFVAFNWLYFAVPCCVLEGRWHIHAICRSILLIKGDFWKVLLGRLAFTLSILAAQYSLYGVAALVIGLLQSSASSFTMDASGVWGALSMAQVSLSTIAGFLFAPLPHIYSVLSYANQRVKKCGLDIELEIHNRQSALARRPGQAGGAYDVPI